MAAETATLNLYKPREKEVTPFPVKRKRKVSPLVCN